MIKLLNTITEELQGSHMIIYHRTKNHQIKDILVNGEFVGGATTGALYGRGLYTTYEDYPEDSNNALNYGNITIKFKVTLDNFLVFDYDVFNKLSSYKKTIEQFMYKKTNKYLVANELTFIQMQLEYYDINPLDAEYTRFYKKDITSEMFLHVYEKNPYIDNVINGAIYTGAQDGKCCLVYNINKAIPLGIRSPESEYKWIPVLNTKEMLKYLKNIYKYGSKGISSKPDTTPQEKQDQITNDIKNQKISNKKIIHVPIYNSELYKCNISKIEVNDINDELMIKKSKIYVSTVSQSDIHNSLLHKCNSFENTIEKSIITKGATKKSRIENSKIIDVKCLLNGIHSSQIIDSKLDQDYARDCKIVNSSAYAMDSEYNIYANTVAYWGNHKKDKFGNCILNNAVATYIDAIKCKIFQSHIEASTLNNCKIQNSQLEHSRLYKCEILDFGNEMDLEVNTLINDCELYDCTINVNNLSEMIEILNVLNRKYKLTKAGIYIPGEISSNLFFSK